MRRLRRHGLAPLAMGLLLAARPIAAGTSREVGFESAGLRLVGTLSIPDGTSAAPAVLLIAGSGPVDRNGLSKAAPAMPPIYEMWAERLDRAGVATLRYDKRFLTHPGIDIPAFDQDDQLADATAAFRFLRGAEGVDRSKVFVLGHSEGGTLAPIVAERTGESGGVIVVNSVLFPVDELLVAQLEANPGVPSATRSEVKTLLSQIEAGSFPAGGLLLGAGADYWRQWIEYSESAVSRLSGLPMPVLLIQCTRDETLPGATLERNLQALRTVASRNARAELRELAGLGHLGLLPGKAEPAAEFMEALIDWIRRAPAQAPAP
jgi:hypothetical protein